MAEAPKTFWVFAGLAVLILAGAIAYKIVSGGGNATIDIAGVKVSVDSAQKGIDSAQAALDVAAKQSENERDQIVTLTKALEAARQQISQLVAEIQSAPSVAGNVKSAAAEVLQAQSARPLPAIEPPNVGALQNAQVLLKEARHSVISAQTQLQEK